MQKRNVELAKEIVGEHKNISEKQIPSSTFQGANRTGVSRT